MSLGEFYVPERAVLVKPVPREAGELHLFDRDRGAREGLQGRARTVRINETARDKEIPVSILVHSHLEVLGAPGVGS